MSQIDSSGQPTRAEEYDDLLEISDSGTESGPEPPEPLDVQAETQAESMGLMHASDLLDPGDEDQGDFEPGGKYKGFQIVPRHLWPDEPQHARWGETRFYVTSPSGESVGLVPWPGSVIVWPWDAAWTLDLHRDEVQTHLRPDEEKKGRKK